MVSEEKLKQWDKHVRRKKLRRIISYATDVVIIGVLILVGLIPILNPERYPGNPFVIILGSWILIALYIVIAKEGRRKFRARIPVEENQGDHE